MAVLSGNSRGDVHLPRPSARPCLLLPSHVQDSSGFIPSEVLSCLGPSEIASFVTSNRSIYHHVHTMGCVSDAKSYRKAVSSNDWRTTYANHFLLARVPGSTGAVAFRLSPLYYGTHLSRKVILQTLTIAGEHGAALWVARHGNMPDPKPSSSGLHLFRSLPWDFLLYSMVCRAMVLSRLPTLRLHIRSIPGIMDRGQRLTASAQSFFCNLLWHARGKAIVLRLCGAPHELPHDPVTRTFSTKGATWWTRCLHKRNGPTVFGSTEKTLFAAAPWGSASS
jgi:hypothetical protein